MVFDRKNVDFFVFVSSQRQKMSLTMFLARLQPPTVLWDEISSQGHAAESCMPLKLYYPCIKALPTLHHVSF